MATNIGTCSRSTSPSPHLCKTLFSLPRQQQQQQQPVLADKSRTRWPRIIGIRALNDGDTYLDMWKNAVDREKKSVHFHKIAEKLDADSDFLNDGVQSVDLKRKTEDFQKILEVPKDERDRIQRMQVVDRAAAAIAAARAILRDQLSGNDEDNAGDIGDFDNGGSRGGRTEMEIKQGGEKNGSIFASRSEVSGNAVPGPDFWSWTPPPASDRNADVDILPEPQRSLISNISGNPVSVKELPMDFLDIPLESKLSVPNLKSHLPPLQSLMEVKKDEVSVPSVDLPSLKEEECEHDNLTLEHELEVAFVLGEETVAGELCGLNADGSRWWKETGTERRPDGVICRWTMTRAVSANQDVEWQEKFWEAADEFGYKELGSEKSGRDATGNVWREYWRESMWQDSGLVHLEKTANKWGKNGKGDEWQEEWWEHYDASNQAEKWAHKWCTIDPTTQLEAGHAHVWHERWGEKYDGHGGTMKYTDKWAERCERDGWTKWGDKWDEHFDPNDHGVKQGETWWKGKHGEQWNRTWGERHNGSGWVHKYGKSSSGEHWDTHVEQETWYERFPHFGFYHCLEHSPQLREVQIPTNTHDS